MKRWKNVEAPVATVAPSFRPCEEFGRPALGSCLTSPPLCLRIHEPHLVAAAPRQKEIDAHVVSVMEVVPGRWAGLRLPQIVLLFAAPTGGRLQKERGKTRCGVSTW